MPVPTGPERAGGIKVQIWRRKTGIAAKCARTWAYASRVRVRLRVRVRVRVRVQAGGFYVGWYVGWYGSTSVRTPLDRRRRLPNVGLGLSGYN